MSASYVDFRSQHRRRAGPEEVSGLVAELVAKGVQIREVKEMGNPFEDLFT